MPKLMVRAVERDNVRDYRHVGLPGMVRIIGKVWDESRGAFVCSGEAVEVPGPGEACFAEFRADVRAGHLTPADAETARVCGVPFVEPTDSTPPNAEG